MREVAFLVCDTLDEAGTIAVLGGGGAATLYAPEAHRTDDLDFILHYTLFSVDEAPIRALGFVDGRRSGLYRHDDVDFTLEFLNGPLDVDGENLDAFDTLAEGGKKLHIISAYDCARDRLAAATHWSDPNSARQAAKIAQAQGLDVEALKNWLIGKHGVRGSAAFSMFEFYYGS
ncbi:hypothetical protein EON81_20875 [bacterium]|nr:MAG: hypothetical protein EON81_20875 [bacterium]